MQHLPRQSGRHLIPQVGHPPIALWDIDYGLELTSGGVVVGWRDVMSGVLACPITTDMLTETTRFSGSRLAMAFAGGAQYLRAEIPQLKRTSGAVAIYAQAVPGDVSTASTRYLLRLGADGTDRLCISSYIDTDDSVYWLANGGGNTSGEYGNSGWSTTEIVCGAVRVSNTRLDLLLDGTLAANSADDTASPLPIAEDLLIGYNFYGSIRRIAIYNRPHTTTEAAAIDAAWRGL
jgi:hypothetical protein